MLSTFDLAAGPGLALKSDAAKPKIDRVAVLTSGGDAPGMNAAIVSAVPVAASAGVACWC